MTLAIMDLVLTLYIEQTREIDTLKDLMRWQASGNQEFLQKLNGIDKWRESKDQILTELENQLERARKIMGENK